MVEPRDIYRAIKSYKTAKKNLAKDKTISRKNKALIVKWLNIKEDSLSSQKGKNDINSQIRYTKTLSKYVSFLRNVARWFDDLSNLTKEDLKKFYDDFETGKIKNQKGKMYEKSTRLDYYNKIFKSGFFKWLGYGDIAKEIFILERGEDYEVRFFEKKDLDKMIRMTNSIRNKLFLTLSFDTGLRIGTTLNLRKKDFKKRYNDTTKQDYYLINVRKEYIKGNRSLNIAVWLPETNELLDLYLKDLKDNDLIFDFSYSNVRKIVRRASDRAKVKTKPDGKNLTIHDFRRSSATYWLTKGCSLDIIKSRLGHKPSSVAIDKYISYLGLNDEQIVTEVQEGNYKELEDAYKETREQLLIIDEKYKVLIKESDKAKTIRKFIDVLMSDKELLDMTTKKTFENKMALELMKDIKINKAT